MKVFATEMKRLSAMTWRVTFSFTSGEQWRRHPLNTDAGKEIIRWIDDNLESPIMTSVSSAYLTNEQDAHLLYLRFR